MADESGFKPSEMVADMVRKALTIGVGAVFMTEETVRTLVKQYKLPTELVAGLLESASRTKEEFFKDLSDKMVNQVMSRVDVSALLHELLQNHEIELKVRFKPLSKAPKKGTGAD